MIYLIYVFSTNLYFPLLERPGEAGQLVGRVVAVYLGELGLDVYDGCVLGVEQRAALVQQPLQPLHAVLLIPAAGLRVAAHAANLRRKYLLGPSPG